MKKVVEQEIGTNGDLARAAVLHGAWKRQLSIIERPTTGRKTSHSQFASIHSTIRSGYECDLPLIEVHVAATGFGGQRMYSLCVLLGQAR